MGVGNVSVSRVIDPPLATVDLQGVEVGRVAMEMLLNRLGDKSAPVEHRVIATRWIDRGSLGEARASVKQGDAQAQS